jgi:ABC-type transport system involved in cytochrome c biogenesis permease subunit
MFKHYINLELKAFFVQLVWEKHWLKILMGFSSLFFTCFLVLGIALYPVRETFPDQNRWLLLIVM